MNSDSKFKSPRIAGAFSFEAPGQGLRAIVKQNCVELLSKNKSSPEYCAALFQGKMIRTDLTQAVGEALGADQASIVKIASAIELLHEASLLHDDIQDRQRIRRGQPTFWCRFGINQAINFGDLLQSLALQPLFDMKSSETILMVRHLNELVSRVIQGQIREQDLVGKLQNRASYEDVVFMKTGALLGAGPELIALHMRETIVFQRLRDAIWHLSLAFQFKNDLDDILNFQESLDFKNKIISMPIVLLIERLHIHDQEGLDKLFNRPRAEIERLVYENKIEVKMSRLISSHLRLFHFHLQKMSNPCLKAILEIKHRLFGEEKLP